MEENKCINEAQSCIKDKKEIRKKLLEKRDALSEAEKMRGSLLLTERILGHQWFYRSEILLGFVNYGSEISTREIIEEALKMGKKVYLPKVEMRKVHSDDEKEIPSQAEWEMKFYRVKSLSELTEGYKGILEPDGTGEEYIYRAEEAEKALMLMPGVAFDLLRNRIGYGKGFYDRYLAGKEDLQLRTIGVGFQCQMVEEIPAEENDIKPYQVICV